MKRLFAAFAVLAPLSFGVLQASASTVKNGGDGDSIDVVNYSVGYDLEMRKTETTLSSDDVNKKKVVKHEQMKLDIGNTVAHFYSYTVFLRDSLMKHDKTKAMQLEPAKLGSEKYETFTDYPAAGQYSMTDKIVRDKYLLQEAMPTADWELCADSVSTILGYACHKATATVLGREWTAWYADDIPLDNGPWLLRGLPGLILRAYTADSLYRFEANGLEKGNGQKPIYYKGGDCEKLSREQLQSLYYRYNSDPIGFINSNTKVQIQILDDNRNEVKKKVKLEYHLLDKTLEKE